MSIDDILLTGYRLEGASCLLGQRVGPQPSMYEAGRLGPGGWSPAESALTGVNDVLEAMGR